MFLKSKVMVLLLVSLGLISMSQASDTRALENARTSADIVGYSLSKVQRWLHEKALPRIEPETGLYHPDGDLNYQDAWADCYPFFVWAA